MYLLSLSHTPIDDHATVVDPDFCRPITIFEYCPVSETAPVSKSHLNDNVSTVVKS
jgi:hypothetical protein